MVVRTLLYLCWPLQFFFFILETLRQLISGVSGVAGHQSGYATTAITLSFVFFFFFDFYLPTNNAVQFCYRFMDILQA